MAYASGTKMISLMKKTLIATLLVSAVSLAQAADWPNWRGPDYNGISSETGWYEKWGSRGPKRLWTASVGTGFAAVSVADGRVFTMGNKSNKDTVYALDEATGETLWKYTYSSPLSPNSYDGGPNATPTVDGDRVYTFSKDGQVYCLEAATGKRLWYKKLISTYKVKKPNWGHASSPYITGEMVILNAGTHGMALDKRSGKLIWKTGTTAAGYATPVPYDHQGTPALVVFGKTRAYGVRVSDGSKLWSKTFQDRYQTNAADPVLYNGNIFLTTNSKDGEMIQLRSSGSSVKTLWRNRDMSIHFNPPVVVGDYLYGFDGRVNNSDDLRCINLKTGDTEWSKSSIPCGSIMASDGKLIILSRKGDLYIAEATPSRFRQLAKARVLTGTCWTVPVLANRSLYVRNSRGTLHKLQMSEMIVEPQPLAVQFGGDRLEFSWPAKGDFILESTDALGQRADWNEVGSGSGKEGDRYVVRVRPSAAQQFFRLRSE